MRHQRARCAGSGRPYGHATSKKRLRKARAMKRQLEGVPHPTGRCSFCGAAKGKAALVTGDAAAICNDCAELCVAMFEGRVRQMVKGDL
jgi:hypothetical protein